MNLINELLIIAGCEPLSEAELCSPTKLDVEIPPQFVQAVYNIVDAFEQHKNDDYNSQVKHKDIEYDTTLFFTHKNSLIDGRISKLTVKLGLTDEYMNLFTGKSTDGYGLNHANLHKKDFNKIVQSFPKDDINKINSLIRNPSNHLETILLSLPFIIKQQQNRRLTNNSDVLKDARAKCAIIYGDAAFIFHTDYSTNTVFVLTFYPITASDKKKIRNKNQEYRKYLKAIQKNKKLRGA